MIKFRIGYIKADKHTVKKFLRRLGPGFIAGAANDDPSCIGTASQAGALFGYRQLWLAPFSFPFLVVMQEICGRIGLVTGGGLAAVIKRYYGRPLLYAAVGVLTCANIINIGADLNAMAAATQLLMPISFSFLVAFFAVGTVGLEVFVPYRHYSRLLQYFAFSLFAYVVVAFMVHQDWGAIVWATFVPHLSFSRAFVMNSIAIMGTRVSPYIFFWQASHEVEDAVLHKRISPEGARIAPLNGQEVHAMRGETLFGMFFSNLIIFFIITAVASTVHQEGITSIENAAHAAQVLRPFAGVWAAHIFALGIIGTGLLAVPILAGGLGYAVAELLGWHAGLHLSVRQAPGFYSIIALATCAGLLVNFYPVDPFMLLYYAAVFNGLVTPFLIFILLCVANNKAIMGEYTNSFFSNIIGWVLGGVLTAAGLFFVWTWIA